MKSEKIILFATAVALGGIGISMDNVFGIGAGMLCWVIAIVGLCIKK